MRAPVSSKAHEASTFLAPARPRRSIPAGQNIGSLVLTDLPRALFARSFTLSFGDTFITPSSSRIVSLTSSVYFSSLAATHPISAPHIKLLSQKLLSDPGIDILELIASSVQQNIHSIKNNSYDNNHYKKSHKGKARKHIP